MTSSRRHRPPRSGAGNQRTFTESQYRRDFSGRFVDKPTDEPIDGTSALNATVLAASRRSGYGAPKRRPVPAEAWGNLMQGPWPERAPTPPPFEETTFIGSAFKHHVSARRMYYAIENAVEYRPNLYPSRAEGRPRPSLYVGYGSTDARVPLEVLASYNDNGELIVFHALRLRERTCRELGYASLDDFIDQNPPELMHAADAS